MNTECRVSGVVWWLGGGCQNVPFWRLREGSGGGMRAHVRGGSGREYLALKKGGVSFHLSPSRGNGHF